jgi:hypothetical protein
LAIAVILFAWWVSADNYPARWPRQFDSAQWKSADWKKRCDMVDDLRERVGIIGKTRGELVLLLGQADGHQGTDSDYWALCNSLSDVFVLDIRWRNGRAISEKVHDT